MKVLMKNRESQLPHFALTSMALKKKTVTRSNHEITKFKNDSNQTLKWLNKYKFKS